MRIFIHTKNFDLTPVIETLVNQKVGVLDKFIAGSSELAEARVEVGKPSKHHQKGMVFYAEINLKLGKQLFRAEEKRIDLQSAVVAARDDIEHQLKKFKTKRRDLSRHTQF